MNDAEELQRLKEKLARYREVRDFMREMLDYMLSAIGDHGEFRPEEADHLMRMALKLFHKADDTPTKRRALWLLRSLNNTDGVDHDFWDLVFWGAMQELVWDTSRMEHARRSESALQAYLVKHWDEFFGNSLRLIQREFRIGRGRVDFMAEDDDGPVLIECKVGPIDEQALQQLERYMREYGRGRGILVGSELRVQLPDGISFMPHKGLYLDEEW